MTGQVKEDILSRFMEIGLRVENGRVSFEPSMLESNEFAADEHEIVRAEHSSGDLVRETYEEGTFLFSICSVPVVFRKAAQTELIVWMQDGSSHKMPDNNLNAELSTLLFLRNGEIKRIEFSYNPENYS